MPHHPSGSRISFLILVFFFNFSGAYINILLGRQGGRVRERRGRGKGEQLSSGCQAGDPPSH